MLKTGRMCIKNVYFNEVQRVCLLLKFIMFYTTRSDCTLFLLIENKLV